MSKLRIILHIEQFQFKLFYDDIKTSNHSSIILHGPTNYNDIITYEGVKKIQCNHLIKI